MTTIKSYTDLSQSKKLAEILPLESADMWWNFYSVTIDDTTPQIIHLDTPWVGSFNWDNKPDNVPCWSLAALLSVLPKGEYKDTDLCVGGYKGDKYIPEWFCSYEQQEPLIIEICHSPNPIDACYAMIIKLHELKML